MIPVRRYGREFSPEGPIAPAEYAQPYAWWGFHWSPPVPLSLVEIVEAGTLDRRAAALLILLIESRRSIVLASEPPMSGKTTLLSALVPFLPEDTRPLFLRGLAETFDYVRDADPRTSYLLVNELSSHLPVYLWGSKATRMFRTLASGFGVGTTMHADDVSEALAELRDALALEAADLARIDVIGVLRTYRGDVALRGHDDVPPELRYGADAIRRRLVGLHLIVARGDRIDTPALVVWDAASDAHRAALDPHVDDLASRTGRNPREFRDALAAREAFLAELATRGVRRPGAVRDAIAAYRGGGR